MTLFYDRGLPLSEFKLTLLAAPTQVPIEKAESNRSLFFTFRPSSLEFKIEYQTQIIFLTLKTTPVENECCKIYEVTSISSSVETFQDTDKKLFILKIET